MSIRKWKVREVWRVYHVRGWDCGEWWHAHKSRVPLPAKAWALEGSEAQLLIHKNLQAPHYCWTKCHHLIAEKRARKILSQKIKDVCSQQWEQMTAETGGLILTLKEWLRKALTDYFSLVRGAKSTIYVDGYCTVLALLLLAMALTYHISTLFLTLEIDLSNNGNRFIIISLYFSLSGSEPMGTA